MPACRRRNPNDEEALGETGTNGDGTDGAGSWRLWEDGDGLYTSEDEE